MPAPADNCRRLASPGQVLQTLLDAEPCQPDHLPTQPALAPLPRHVDADMQFAANLFVVQALTGRLDDARPQCNLLGSAMRLDELFEPMPLCFTQVDGGRFRTFHVPASDCGQMIASYPAATSASTGGCTLAITQPRCTSKPPYYRVATLMFCGDPALRLPGPDLKRYVCMPFVIGTH